VACTEQTSDSIRIAAAANMQYALVEINKAFTTKFNIKTELIFSSSGKLTAQIIEGAPYDILLSADLKYPNSIYQKGLSRSKPEIYASGQLVLWSMNEDIQSLQKIAEPSIKHIAIANPKTAPYGKAAIECFQNAGILKEIEDKLVFGESISQVNQFILSHSADVGITAKSAVLSNQLQGKGNWIDINNNQYHVIDQAALGYSVRE